MIQVRRFDRLGALREGDALALPGPDADEVLWVDVVDPTTEELDAVGSTFGLHSLSLEDTLRVGHPPKLEEFDTHLFLIVHTPSRDDGGLTRKLALFLGRNWIVTILRLPVENLEETLTRMRAAPGRLTHGPATILYRLIDAMTDGFEHEVDQVAEQLTELEDRTQQDPSDDTMHAIVELRNELTRLARIVRSQRDVSAMLARASYEHIPDALAPYMRDVYDHLLRVHDQIEGARDAVLAVRDLYLALVNNRLSEIMRVLTIIATVMMPLSLVAGVWGMNVGGLPGLEWSGAFWLLAAVMVLVGGAMLAWFRHRRWL